MKQVAIPYLTVMKQFDNMFRFPYMGHNIHNLFIKNNEYFFPNLKPKEINKHKLV